MIHLTEDEYRSLVMGEYRLTPCVCDGVTGLVKRCGLMISLLH